MSAHEPPADDRFAELLAAHDEALSGGPTDAGAGAPEVPPEWRPRLERDLACLRLLRGVLRPGAGAPSGGGARLGRFEVLRELGRGAHGVVFLAYDPRLGRAVALKVPRPEALATPELRQRFLREARAAAGLDHPNLVPVYEAGAAGAVCYIAAAYCPGPTLADWLQGAGPVPPREAARLVLALAEAVQHAHERGVVHRDLKPSNVLLASGGREPSGPGEPAADAAGSPNGGSRPPLAGCVPKVTDFGLAKFLDPAETGRTDSGAIVGTPSYMAPEQAAGKVKEVGPAADVYGLGAILYELLTGRPPFRAETPLDTVLQVLHDEPVRPARRHPRVPRDLETVCLKCLRKDPPKRYASARELADDLRRFLAGEPVRARPVGALERGGKWARRHPARALLLAGGLVAAAALVAGALWHNAALKAERDYAVGQERLATSRAADAATQRARAEGRERDARRNLYAAQLSRARYEWEAGRVGRVLDLLEGQRPGPGEEDLRGFEWHYLWRLCHGERFRWDAPPPERYVPTGHRSPLLALSADGRKAACADGAAVRLWEAGTGRESAALVHPAAVCSLAFSADGRRLASGALDGAVRLWDAEAGGPGAVLGHRPGAAEGVALSADGRWLAAVWSEGEAQLWDAAAGQRRAAFASGRPAPALLTFAPGGGALAGVTGAGRNEVTVWGVPGGEVRAVLRGHTYEILGLFFSPDGRRLMTGSNDRTLRLWDVSTGKELWRFRHPGGAWGTCVAFSPDGRSFATGAAYPFEPLLTGEVTVWDAATFAGRAAWPVARGGAWALAFAPDGKSLAVGEDGGAIRVRNLASGEDRVTLRGHTRRVHRLAFGPGGEALTSYSFFDRTVRCWGTGPPPEAIRGHAGRATCVAFTPDGRALVTGGADGAVCLRDPVAGRRWAALPAHPAPVEALALAPDGRLLATGAWDGQVRLLAVPARPDATGPWKAALPQRGVVYSLRFSPDGRLLLTAGGKERAGGFGEVSLWEVGTGRARARWQDAPHVVRAVAFSPDGRLLAAAGEEDVWVWDTDRGPGPEARWSWRVPGAAFMSLAFSPDGTALVAGDWSGWLRLWDLATGRERAAVRGHTDAVYCLAFQPGSGALASGGRDGAVKLWDVAPGPQERFTLEGQPAAVLGLAFSSDGRKLAAVRYDGSVEVWNGADDHRVDDAWLRAVAALPAERQAEAVARMLQERNPGFPGRVATEIEGGIVRGLTFSAGYVADLSPLQALPGLRKLCCDGPGPLADLSALRGLPLTELSVANTRVTELGPLRGMPLTRLDCSNTAVADLSPLRDLPLTDLSCDVQNAQGAAVVRSVRTLKVIRGRPAEEFWRGCGGR